MALRSALGSNLMHTALADHINAEAIGLNNDFFHTGNLTYLKIRTFNSNL